MLIYKRCFIKQKIEVLNGDFQIRENCMKSLWIFILFYFILALDSAAFTSYKQTIFWWFTFYVLGAVTCFSFDHILEDIMKLNSISYEILISIPVLAFHFSLTWMHPNMSLNSRTWCEGVWQLWHLYFSKFLHWMLQTWYWVFSRAGISVSETDFLCIISVYQTS